MKLFHPIGEQRDGCMISAVLEPKRRFRITRVDFLFTLYAKTSCKLKRGRQSPSRFLCLLGTGSDERVASDWLKLYSCVWHDEQNRKLAHNNSKGRRTARGLQIDHSRLAAFPLA